MRGGDDKRWRGNNEKNVAMKPEKEGDDDD